MAWEPDYATTAEVKSYTRIADTLDDAEIGFAITGASRAIDRFTNRQFGLVAAPEERFYTGRWDRHRGRWVIDIDDLMTETGFDAQVQDADGNDLGAITPYVLEPRNSAAIGRPWTYLVPRPSSAFNPTGCPDEVAITARWGWTASPTTIKEACLMQTSRFLHRRDSPWGIAGSPDIGSELRLLARLDPDVQVLIGSYYRWWGAQ